MKAAKTVQSVWRGYLGRRDFRRLRILIGKVRTIQRAWKGWEEGRRGREERRKRAEEEYEGFLQRMEEFKRDWPEIKLKRRVEVHICSFSFEEMRRLTMEKFVQRQNSQICRIFRLKDPDIEIVYVAPFDLSPELISYYHKILDLAGIPNYKERLHFVWPVTQQKKIIKHSNPRAKPQQPLPQPKTLLLPPTPYPLPYLLLPLSLPTKSLPLSLPQPLPLPHPLSYLFLFTTPYLPPSNKPFLLGKSYSVPLPFTPLPTPPLLSLIPPPHQTPLLLLPILHHPRPSLQR